MSTPYRNDGPSAVAITREQRDVLVRELRLQMSGLGDVVMTDEGHEPAPTPPGFDNFERADLAERRGYLRTFAAVLWLLDDLAGWDEPDDDDSQRDTFEGDTYEVTLPVDRFAWWLRDREAATRESVPDLCGEDVNEALDVHNTCRALLGAVA